MILQSRGDPRTLSHRADCRRVPRWAGPRPLCRCAGRILRPRRAAGLVWCRWFGDDVVVSIRRVLVVGAGIAGSTLAYWLARSGIETTVVERAAGQYSSGGPVDVRGPALPVIEQMHLLAPVREAATPASRLTVVDGSGGRIGWVPTRASDHAVEIPRSDLAAILSRAARAHADFLYDNTVKALHDDGQGVDVTFDRAGSDRFDLVVGTDGVHSRVRRLAFGPDALFLAHLGLSIATTTLPETTEDRHTVFMHNAPGRAVAIHPAADRDIAAFLFRHRGRPNIREQDTRHNKQRVIDAYTGMHWRVPELLERVRDSSDLSFDSASRVRLNSWTRGRTVLVGDAANGDALLGDGSSMAIAGAATLAHELQAQPAEPATALSHYEHTHRKRLARGQRGAAIASHLIVPATRTGTVLRNTAFRLWPLITAARRTRTIA